MSRLEDKFAELKKAGRKGLITFIMGGDPDYKTSLEIFSELPKTGADIIEIGMPFSDPMADGPAIQAAGRRAIEAGMTLTKVLQMVREFRKNDKTTPVILMGYLNPIHFMGVEKFASEAKKCGVDGVIIVDVPPEEDQEISGPLKKYELDQIRLIAPTTPEERIRTITEKSSGFVYYVSIAGITGTKSANMKDTGKAVERIKKITNVPVAIGFGIKNQKHVSDAAQYGDAVVVGSALVKIIEENSKNKKTIISSVQKFVKELSRGLK